MSEPSPTAIESSDQREADWRSYILLLIFQTQNAFNDKAAQFVLIPLAAYLAMQAGDETGGKMHLILSGLIVLPYVVLSPVVGWLSDRVSKVGIVRAMAVLQVAVMGWIYFAIKRHELWWAVAGFFVLAVQSTILSPAKKGVIKELVGGKKLGLASGLLEMAAILAILAGQIATSFWFGAERAKGSDGWQAGEMPLLVVGIASVPALLLTLGMRSTAPRSTRAFDRGIWLEHFHQLRGLWSDRVLRLCSLGICYFWTYGGFVLLLFIQISNEVTGEMAGATWLAYLMSASSGGVVLGGVIASIVCRRRIELGLVPIGGLLMVIGSVMAAFSPPEGRAILLWLAVSGVGAASYLVPLNALLQDRCEPDQRGSVLAAVNFQDCLGGMLAVFLQGSLALFFGVQAQFIFVATTALFATILALRLMPQAVIRLVLTTLLRPIYRVKPVHYERMPESGGVLMVSNHVSFADAFFLSLASARPVRFVVADEYVKIRSIRWFLKLFNVVPISTKKAKEAIRTAADALKAGDLICIFPEGQLTRTGVMNELQQGYRLIARQAKCPVIPVYMDGAWGSIFSFERGRFFKKRPNALKFGIPVIFGEPSDAKDLDTARLRKQFERLCQELIEHENLTEIRKLLERKLKKRKLMVSSNGQNYSGSQLAKMAKETSGNSDPKIAAWLSAWNRVMEDENYARLAYTNAVQLMRVNALVREQHLAIECDDEVSAVLGVVFPIVAKTPVHLEARDDLARSDARQWIVRNEGDLPEDVAVFQLCTDTAPQEGALAIGEGENGFIYSTELNLAEFAVKNSRPQLGQRPGSLGVLLPGIAREGDRLSGPHGMVFSVPEGFHVDDEGWILPVSEEDSE